MNTQVILWSALAAAALMGGKSIYGHVFTPVGHAVCRVATLGHKCKTSQKSAPKPSAAKPSPSPAKK